MEAIKTAPSGFFFTDEGTGQSYPLGDGFIIGRTTGEIRFSLDIRMSGKHAKVTIQNTDVYIEDLGSRNGVIVNGKRIDNAKKIRLFPGDILVMGSSTLCLGRYSAPEIVRDDDESTAVIAKPKPRETAKLSLPNDPAPAPIAAPVFASQPSFEHEPEPEPEGTPTPRAEIEDLPDEDVSVSKSGLLPISSSPEETPFSVPADALSKIHAEMKEKEQSFANKSSQPPPVAAPTTPSIPVVPQKVVSMIDKLKQKESANKVHYVSDDDYSYPEVKIFIMLMAVGFGIVMYASGGMFQPSPSQLITWGANYAPKTTHGEWWRLLSSAFIHSSFMHLFINMLLVWKAGRLITEFLGTLTFFCIAIVTQIVTSMIAVWLQPQVSFVGAHAVSIGLFSAAMLLGLRNSHAGEITDRGTLVFGFLILMSAHAQSAVQSAKDLILFGAAAAVGALLSMVCAPANGFVDGAWWMKYVRPSVVMVVAACGIYLAVPMIPRAADGSENFAALVNTVLPLAKSHDQLRVKMQKGEIANALALASIEKDQLPKLRQFEKSLTTVAPFADVRDEAVANMKTAVRAWIESWELQAEALASGETAIAVKSIEREKQGFAALDRANKALHQWKSSGH